MKSDKLLEKSARAFAFWMGNFEIVENPCNFLNELNAKLREKLHHVGKNLYGYVDENNKSPVGKYLKVPTDQLLFDIAKEISIKHVPFWPNNAPYAVCLTHDIDRISSTYRTAAERVKKGRLFTAALGMFSKTVDEYNEYDNFARIADYEEAWGIRSALYVLFEKRRLGRAFLKGELQHLLGVYNPEEIGGVLCNLESRGFEIGLHGSLDAYNNKEALTNEKEKLVKLLRTKDAVKGVRNHYLQFDAGITPYVHNECGIVYDSTIGFNFTCGFPCGTTFPFAFFPESNRCIVELPLNVMDTSLKYAAPGREAEVAETIAEEVRKKGGLLMINWHQRFCNKEIDPVMYNWVERTIEKAQRDRAFLAKPLEVARYWMNRIKN